MSKPLRLEPVIAQLLEKIEAEDRSAAKWGGSYVSRARARQIRLEIEAEKASK